MICCKKLQIFAISLLYLVIIYYHKYICYINNICYCFTVNFLLSLIPFVLKASIFFNIVY